MSKLALLADQLLDLLGYYYEGKLPAPIRDVLHEIDKEIHPYQPIPLDDLDCYIGAGSDFWPDGPIDLGGES